MAWAKVAELIGLHANLSDITATDHHDNANDPSANENAALAGYTTIQAPDGTRRYILATPETVATTPEARITADVGEHLIQVKDTGIVGNREAHLWIKKYGAGNTGWAEYIVAGAYGNITLDQLAALANSAGDGHGNELVGWEDVLSISLDQFAATTDITTLNASTSAHGLLPKLTGYAYDVLNGEGAWEPVINYRKLSLMESDFMGALAQMNAPFYITGVSSGTYPIGSGEANHPGVLTVKASATNNSGAVFNGIGLSNLLLAGGEETTVIFKADLLTDVVHRHGFTNESVISVSAPTNGVWMESNEGVMTGYAVDGSGGPTATASTYTMTAEVWYRCRVSMNSDASVATFEIFTCSNGTRVWNDTVSSTIPTTAGEEVGHHFKLYKKTGSSGTLLATVDYCNVLIRRELTR